MFGWGAEHVERHADTADYLLVLRLTFVNWGLPQQLRVDRDSVDRDNTSKSPFPTRLHLFLLGLGIELAIGASAPATQAGDHRTHPSDLGLAGAGRPDVCGLGCALARALSPP